VTDYLSIIALGSNKPDLAEQLINAVMERGCEIQDCRAFPVGSKLSVSLLVRGNWSELGRLESALPGLSERFATTIHFARSERQPRAPQYRAYAVEVIAPRQHQLLPRLLHFFSEQGAIVDEISAQEFESAHTGAAMCNLQLMVDVPLNGHPPALRESFMDLCDELSADGILDPVKT
jgi:glycine cleavage system transcriptional repressor